MGTVSVGNAMIRNRVPITLRSLRSSRLTGFRKFRWITLERRRVDLHWPD